MSKDTEDVGTDPSPVLPTKKKVSPFTTGVVLGPDGKPCRNCTSFSNWAAGQSKMPSNKVRFAQDTVPLNCPPDSLTLGRHSWTLLHSLPYQYPSVASTADKTRMSTFLKLFSQLYPCSPCAKDFEEYIEIRRPALNGQEEFGKWLCEAHNAVNEKLGKERFDCTNWRKRWIDGGAGC